MREVTQSEGGITCGRDSGLRFVIETLHDCIIDFISMYSIPYIMLSQWRGKD